MNGTPGADGRDYPAIDRRQFLRSSGAGLSATAWIGSQLPTAAGQTSWEEIWRFEAGPFTASPTIVDGTVYVTDEEEKVFALSAESGELLWQQGLEVLNSWGAPVVSNGTVFVGGYGVYAFDADTGDEKWVNEDEGGATGVNVADGIVFAQHGDLTALNAATGGRLWKHSSGDDNDTSPTIANGVVFFGSRDDNVYALDTVSGDEYWHFETGGSVNSSPAVSRGTVFFGSNDENLYAVDATSGREEWQFSTGSPIGCAPTVADGTVFFGNRNSDFVAVDASTGEEQWRVDTAGWVETAPTVVDGTVVFGSWDGVVYGADATTGDVLWRFETEGESRSSAPTVVNGTAFFGDSAGNLYAVDTGVDGSSEDSRVLHGTLGHHGEWRHAEQTFGPNPGQSGPDIENLRLVQTVENTRYVDPDSDLSGHYDGTPVADALVPDESHDAVPWTAPEADFVAQRAVAPVFDVTPSDPEEQPNLSLTARLVGDHGTVREERTTLDAAAIRGELSAAHRVRLQERGVVEDGPAPLLESIRDDPDRVEGEYPTLPAASGVDVEVELDGPGLEEPITETLAVDSDRVRAGRRFSIGFVPFETTTLTGTGTYTFDDDAPATTDFAKNAARRLNAMFPTVGIDIAVVTGSLDGPTANDPRAFRNVVRRAESTFAGSLDDAQTFHVSPDGELSERAVHSVDAAVAVVPQDGFFGGGALGSLGDEQTRGLFPRSTIGDDPIADAVIVEIDRERTVAHELVHLFAGEIYDDITDVTALFGPSNHAPSAVTSTGFDLQNGEFEFVPGARSLMEPGTGRWIDAVAYQELIENVDPKPSLSPRCTAAWSSDVAGRVATLRRKFEDAPDSYLETVPDGNRIRDRLVDLEAELTATVDESDGYWDATADLTQDQRDSIRQLTMITGGIADLLVSRGSNLVGDTPETAEDLGEHVKREAEAIEAALDGRRDGGVEHVLELDGSLGEEIDLDARAIPTVEPVEPVDGRASIRALDVDGEVVDETTAATGVELLGQAGTATREDVIVGTVRAPPSAATVEVTVEPADDDDDGAVRSTAMHPATDPIRTQLEALPDRAFDGDGVRSDALESLESVESYVESGDRESAAETLERLYQDVYTGLASEFRRQAGDEPVRTAVLDRIAEQIHRFGGDVPVTTEEGTDDGGNDEDDIPTSWLVGGAGVGGAALLGGGYLHRQRSDGEAGDDTR